MRTSPLPTLPKPAWALCWLAVLLSTHGLAAQQATPDTKRLADQILRGIRLEQHEDGSYGEGYRDTCRVLDLMGRSPRRYNELDGPFFRRAAAFVASHEPADLPERAWKALALSGVVTASLRAQRDATLAAIAQDPAAWSHTDAVLAMRSVKNLRSVWPAAPADAEPALRCLLADDPGSVEAPAFSDTSRWMAWARAARLRGLQPAQLPPLPSPRPGASFEQQLDDLALVILSHGLDREPGHLSDAEPAPRPAKVSTPFEPDAALAAALAWLDAHQQAGTFGLELPGWSGPEPGITAMCLSAAISAADTLGQERPAWVADGLDFLSAMQREDGAIVDYGLAVYTTSVALEAFLDGGRPEDKAAVIGARDFLVAMQADEDLGYDSIDDPHYGGIGYGGDERPDLSNTQMALEAAVRAGLPEDSAFLRKALLFLEKTQNLGEISARSWPRPDGGTTISGRDGGATYMPGNSPAGEDELGSGIYQPRSYGSMTYALTKSYLLCGLDLSNQRVSAAIDWLMAHYTLDRNPGFKDPAQGQDGLFYYYLALARTLSRLPDERLHDSQGQPIDWRADLQRTLLSRQRIDGSWFNEQAPRWFEGAPTLCTAYALLALGEARTP